MREPIQAIIRIFFNFFFGVRGRTGGIISTKEIIFFFLTKISTKEILSDFGCALLYICVYGRSKDKFFQGGETDTILDSPKPMAENFNISRAPLSRSKTKIIQGIPHPEAWVCYKQAEDKIVAEYDSVSYIGYPRSIVMSNFGLKYFRPMI